MRICGLLLLVGGLVACSTPPTATPSATASPPSSGTAVADEAWPWPDVRSDRGGWTMRLRPVVGAYAIATEAGPGIAMEAHLVTDDANVLLAGGPRASVLRPTETLAQGKVDALDADTWSGRTSDRGRTALVHVPANVVDTRPVDIEIRCRLMRVREWTTHELGSFGPGRHEGRAAHPYSLVVECHDDSVVVSAATPGVPRSGATKRDGVAHLLPHSWAAQAIEVRDARGALLDTTDEAGTERSSSVAYRSVTREHRGPIGYPVALRLRVPMTYDVEYPMFHWRGISLPTVGGAASSGSARDVRTDLPPALFDPDALRRECAAALAASDPKATTWHRIAVVLLRSSPYMLRERLAADAAAGSRDAPDLLQSLDSWKSADEAAFDQMLAECRRTRDVDRLVVGMMNAGNDQDAARLVDAIADVDPRAALLWLRLKRADFTGVVCGGTESRILRDDLLRSLDQAIDAATR